MPHARAGLSKYEGLFAQLLERDLLALAPDVFRRHHQYHAVGSKMTELQMWIVCFSADKSQLNLALFHLMDHRHAVADARPHLDVGITPVEDRQNGWQKMLAGYGTCPQGKFPGDGELLAGNLRTGLLMNGDDPLIALVEPLAGLRQ